MDNGLGNSWQPRGQVVPDGCCNAIDRGSIRLVLMLMSHGVLRDVPTKSVSALQGGTNLNFEAGSNPLQSWFLTTSHVKPMAPCMMSRGLLAECWSTHWMATLATTWPWPCRTLSQWPCQRPSQRLAELTRTRSWMAITTTTMRHAMALMRVSTMSQTSLM